MKSLSPSQPHAIIMVGMPGSGKSFFAEKFAETFHAPLVSCQVIQQQAKISKAGATNTALYFVKELLKTKQSIIIDGIGESAAARLALGKLAKQAGYDVLLIWTQTDIATAKNRSTRDTKTAPAPMTEESFNKRVGQFQAPTPLEHPVVVSGKHTYASQAKAILKRLSESRTEAVKTADITPDRPPIANRRRLTIR